MSKIKIEDISLRDALAVVNNLDTAAAEDIVAARKTISSKMKEITAMYNKLSSALESLPEGEQGTLVFSTDTGDTTEILTEEVEVVKIDRKQLIADANPNVSVSYSDTAYDNIFSVKPTASKKKILAAESAGLLPNASSIVKRTYITQTKLFDYKEEQ